MSTQAAGLVVFKTVTVRAPREHAFDVFTARMGEWWPLMTHSVGEERAKTVTMEPRVGGRFFESIDGGEESDWGSVLAWEPPARVLLSWHPGGSADEATELEVRFAEDGDGSTRVELEHRGWEVLGDRAAASRDTYDGGWPGVLAAFVEAADR